MADTETDMLRDARTLVKRRVFALFAVTVCLGMLFIEKNRIVPNTIPIIYASLPLTLIYIASYFKERRIFLTSFYQIYYMIGLLVSSVSISSGASMVEVGAHGDANGSFWIILIFFLVGMEATSLGFTSKTILSGIARKAPIQSWDSSRLMIMPILAVAIILSLYVFFTTGGPIISGVDRITFWRFMVPEYLQFIPSMINQIYFIAAFYFLWSLKRGEALLLPAGIVIALMLIIVFVLGQKFSAFILAASAWLIVVSGTFPNFKVKPSHLVLIVSVALFLVVLISISYVREGRDPSFIFTRVALQAQLMWSVLADPYGFQILPSTDWRCLISCGWYEDGKDFISQRYLPQDLYRLYEQVGTEISGFMPALQISTLGLALAFAMHIAISFFLGAIQREISRLIENGSFLASFLLHKVHFSLALAWFAAQSAGLMGSLMAAAALSLYVVIQGQTKSALGPTVTVAPRKIP